MNDFTKEELESILDAFHYLEDSPSWRNIDGWDRILADKIQSMIDNYCEHECLEVRDINCIESCPTCVEHHDNHS